jgi:hypothetical protein
VQVSKDVTVQVEYNMGTPGPGENPDRTLLKVGWHLHRRWLVEATIGDLGSSMLDLLWSFRY